MNKQISGVMRVGIQSRRTGGRKLNFGVMGAGYRGNADENAALNIWASGNGASGHGGGRTAWLGKCQKAAQRSAGCAT